MSQDKHIFEEVRQQTELLREILRQTVATNYLSGAILSILRREEHRPAHLTLTLDWSSAMQGITGQTATATVVETDAQGNVVVLVPANISFSIDNTAVATVSPNGDGTATVTAVGPGTATLTATDSTNTLTGTAPIVVTAAGGGTGGTGTPTLLSVTVGPFSTPAAGGSVAAAAQAKPLE